MEGHKLMFDDLIVTVWSAPNYCYRFVSSRCLLAFSTMLEFPADLVFSACPCSCRCGNVASILELNESLTSTYKTFDAAAQVRYLLTLLAIRSIKRSSRLISLLLRFHSRLCFRTREGFQLKQSHCSTSSDHLPVFLSSYRLYLASLVVK